MRINTLAERIARGETDLGLAVGCEVLGSVAKRMARDVGFDDWLEAEDLSLEGVEYRESIKPLLDSLPARERRILMLRFFGNLTQSQIAARIGISQMHVSRLIRRSLERVRVVAGANGSN